MNGYNLPLIFNAALLFTAGLVFQIVAREHPFFAPRNGTHR